MKIIEKLSDMIDDEICGAKDYAKFAIELKDDYPSAAETLYRMSNDEMSHMNNLHKIVVEIIEDYRKVKGEPPADMLAVYEYLHKKSIDKAEKVKRYQELFKM